LSDNGEGGGPILYGANNLPIPRQAPTQPTRQIRPTGDTTKSYGSGSPGRHLDSSIKDLSKAGSEVDKLGKDLDKALSNTTEHLKDSNKEVAKLVRGLNDLVTDSTDFESSMKAIIKTQRELVKTGMFDDRSRGKILKDLKLMRDSYEKASEGMYDERKVAAYRKAIDGINKQIETIGKTSEGTAANMEEMLDPAMAAAMTKGLSDTNDELVAMIKHVEHLKGLSKDLAVAFKQVQTNGGWLSNTKMVQGINSFYEKKGANLEAARKMKGSREDRLGAERDAYKKVDQANFKSERTGFSGMLDNRLAKMAADKPDGMMGKLAAKGGGSVISGIGSKLVGGVELGSIGISNMMGKMAGPIAVAQSLAKVYDMNIEQNKKVNELAAGGLYGEDEGVAKSLSNMRNTLASSSLFEQTVMGQGTEKNLNVFKNLIEGGRNISDAAGKNLGDITQSGSGFYGSVMKNAVYNSSPIGLSQDQGINLQLKAIDEYQATLSQINGFFVDINKSTKAAGISTGKYLEIIDSVNGNFDNMNKSLTTSVNLLNTLGRTGRLTGDRMKEVLTTLTSNNIGSPELRIAAMSKMSKEDIDSVTQGLQRETDSMKKNLQESMLKDAGIDISNMGSIGEYEDALKKKKDSGSIDSNTYQTLVGNISDYRNKVRNNEGYSKAINNGDFATAAGIHAVQGTGAIGNMNYNLSMMGLLASGSGTSLSKLLSSDVKTNAGEDQKALAFALGNKQFMGVDVAKMLNASREAMRSGATDTIDMSAKGQLSGEYLSNIVKELGSKGLIDIGGKTSKEDLVDIFTKLRNGETTLKDGKNFTDALTELDTVRQGFLSGALGTSNTDGKKEIDQAKKKAEDIAINTRTTADLYAQSFEYLFTKVINVLQKILSVVSLGLSDPSQDQVKNAANATELSRSVNVSKLSPEASKRFMELKGKDSLTDEEYKEFYNLSRPGMREEDQKKATAIMNQQRGVNELTSGEELDKNKSGFLSWMKTMGGIDVQGQGGVFSLDNTANGVDKYKYVIQDAIDKGFLKAEDMGNGKDTKYTYISTTYNSVDVAGTTPNKTPNDSGQTATNPTTGKPVGAP
jgi:hypothetical protein